MAKYVIGLDVGFAAMGASLFELPDFRFVRAKVFRTDPQSKKQRTRVDTDNIRRINEMNSMLMSFCMHTNLNKEQLKGKHTLSGDMSNIFVCAEFPTAGTKNANASYKMGISTGMVSTFLIQNKILHEHVTPEDVKFIATGRKQKVSKQDVIDGVSRTLEINKLNGTFKRYLIDEHKKGDWDHIADSIAAVLWSRENSQLLKVFLQ